jgi:hypothetical protein
MVTIRELGERGIALRSLREGIDTSSAAGRMAGDTVFLPRNVPHTYVLTSAEAELLTICNPAGLQDFIRAAGWNLSVAKPEDWVVDMQAIIEAAEATGQMPNLACAFSARSRSRASHRTCCRPSGVIFDTSRRFASSTPFSMTCSYAHSRSS